MEAQQIFDTVVNHLRKQGHKSLLTEEQMGSFRFITVCAYLSSNGDKCAAGTLILSDEYDPRMEKVNIGVLLKNPDHLPFEVPTSLRDRLGPHYLLIEDLQWVHDRMDVIDWEWQWQKIAREHDLTYTPPGEATDVPPNG